MLGDQPDDRAIPWGQTEDVMVRVPEHDFKDRWAWRFERPCDDTCHHPIHAFNRPKGLRHMEWFEPGDTSLTEVKP